jgi:hypothetical protein
MPNNCSVSLYTHTPHHAPPPATFDPSRFAPPTGLDEARCINVTQQLQLQETPEQAQALVQVRTTFPQMSDQGCLHI